MAGPKVTDTFKIPDRDATRIGSVFRALLARLHREGYDVPTLGKLWATAADEIPGSVQTQVTERLLRANGLSRIDCSREGAPNATVVRLYASESTSS